MKHLHVPYNHPKVVERVALNYQKAPDEIDVIDTLDAALMRDLVHEMFNDVLSKIDVYFVDTDPYEYVGLDDIMADFNRGFIKVNKSGDDSKFWGSRNLEFRAVHDYIHCWFNLPFNYLAEVKAFARQVAYSQLPKFSMEYPNFDWELYSKVLRSEIIYQAAYKQHFKEFHVPVQKIILSNL